MKKIQREVKTYTDIFVSVDGREFTNEADCKAWENSYKGTLNASVETLKKLETSADNLYLPNSSCDEEVWVIKPKNLDEITLLNAFIDWVTSNNGTLLTTSMIGKEIALNFGYDRSYCDVYVLEEHLNNVEKAIANIMDEFNKEN